MFHVLTGDGWPAVDEDEINDLAQLWLAAGQELMAIAPEVTRTARWLADSGALVGDSAKALSQTVAVVTGDGDLALEKLAAGYEEMGNYLHGVAVQTQYMKIIVIEQLIILAAQILYLLAMIPWTFGASAAGIAALQVFGENFMWTMAKQLVIAVVTGEVLQLGLDAITQFAQIMERQTGHSIGRTEWDKNLTASAAITGVIGGALSPILGVLGHYPTKALGSALGGLLGKNAAHEAGEWLGETIKGGVHEWLTDGMSGAAQHQGWNPDPFSTTAGAIDEGISGLAGMGGRKGGHRYYTAMLGAGNGVPDINIHIPDHISLDPTRTGNGVPDKASVDTTGTTPGGPAAGNRPPADQRAPVSASQAPTADRAASAGSDGRPVPSGPPQVTTSQARRAGESQIVPATVPPPHPNHATPSQQSGPTRQDPPAPQTQARWVNRMENSPPPPSTGFYHPDDVTYQRTGSYAGPSTGQPSHEEGQPSQDAQWEQPLPVDQWEPWEQPSQDAQGLSGILNYSPPVYYPGHGYHLPSAGETDVPGSSGGPAYSEGPPSDHAGPVEIDPGQYGQSSQDAWPWQGMLDQSSEYYSHPGHGYHLPSAGGTDVPASSGGPAPEDGFRTDSPWYSGILNYSPQVSYPGLGGHLPGEGSSGQVRSPLPVEIDPGQTSTLDDRPPANAGLNRDELERLRKLDEYEQACDVGGRGAGKAWLEENGINRHQILAWRRFREAANLPIDDPELAEHANYLSVAQKTALLGQYHDARDAGQAAAWLARRGLNQRRMNSWEAGLNRDPGDGLAPAAARYSREQGLAKVAEYDQARASGGTGAGKAWLQENGLKQSQIQAWRRLRDAAQLPIDHPELAERLKYLSDEQRAALLQRFRDARAGGYAEAWLAMMNLTQTRMTRWEGRLVPAAVPSTQQGGFGAPAEFFPAPVDDYGLLPVVGDPGAGSSAAAAERSGPMEIDPGQRSTLDDLAPANAGLNPDETERLRQLDEYERARSGGWGSGNAWLQEHGITTTQIRDLRRFRETQPAAVPSTQQGGFGAPAEFFPAPVDDYGLLPVVGDPGAGSSAAAAERSGPVEIDSHLTFTLDDLYALDDLAPANAGLNPDETERLRQLDEYERARSGGWGSGNAWLQEHGITTTQIRDWRRFRDAINLPIDHPDLTKKLASYVSDAQKTALLRQYHDARDAGQAAAWLARRGLKQNRMTSWETGHPVRYNEYSREEGLALLDKYDQVLQEQALSGRRGEGQAWLEENGLTKGHIQHWRTLRETQPAAVPSTQQGGFGAPAEFFPAPVDDYGLLPVVGDPGAGSSAAAAERSGPVEIDSHLTFTLDDLYALDDLAPANASGRLPERSESGERGPVAGMSLEPHSGRLPQRSESLRFGPVAAMFPEPHRHSAQLPQRSESLRFGPPAAMFPEPHRHSAQLPQRSEFGGLRPVEVVSEKRCSVRRRKWWKPW